MAHAHLQVGDGGRTPPDSGRKIFGGWPRVRVALDSAPPGGMVPLLSREGGRQQQLLLQEQQQLLLQEQQ